MIGYIGRFKEFIRYSHPYRKAMYVAVFGVVLIFCFGLVFLLPEADATSVQSGLSVIAEILGVILGAVLVVVVLLIEQRLQAEELLRGNLQKYRCLIQSRLGSVNSGRQQLVEQVKEGKTRLDEPVFVGPSGKPSSTKVRDVIEALSALVSVYSTMFPTHEFEKVEQDLRILGYSEEEAIGILHAEGSMADTDSENFLRLVSDALDLSCIATWCDNTVSNLALEVYGLYGRDGIHTALRRSDRAQRFLKSETFIAGITIPTLTTVLTILTIFGITDRTVFVPIYGSVVVAVITGFTLSIVLTLLLVEKMIT